VRLFHKIAALLIIAGSVPLGTVGFQLVRRNEQALEAEVRARFSETARHAAEAVAADIEGRARLLAQVTPMIRWADLDPGEARGALALVKRQAHATDAALFDVDGAEFAVRAVDGNPLPLTTHAPRRRAQTEGTGAVVFSTPFHTDRGPALAAAIGVEGGVLAFLIPLEPEAERLAAARTGEVQSMRLVDDRGEPILSSGGLGPRPLPTVSAAAQVGGLGWSVIVEEDETRAFRAARSMRADTLTWTFAATLGALALAFVFARRLTRALERLAVATRALGSGELTTRVDAVGTDELAALGRSFNHMGEELTRSRQEIEGWNRELEARVEARTRELKEAQAQLVEAQKLAALGQLGAGAAHEINNPLGGVIGHVELLLSGRPKDHPDYDALACIEEGAKKAAQVVQNLLRFSVQHVQAVRAPVDANRLVRETLSLTTSLLTERKIEVAFTLAEPAPRVMADAGQLGQVILNLVSNARTAMPSGGALTLFTEPAGPEVAIGVSDTGKGIAPEIRERIFDPFFTTKDDWSNVGLGLSTSYRIVSEHGGRIVVESQVGRGSKFTVYLPAT
jgi:signal transduction histidine kinase